MSVSPHSLTHDNPQEWHVHTARLFILWTILGSCLLLFTQCQEPTEKQQSQAKYNRDHWTSL
ncbi:MAG: hypothetical protein AAGJ35_10550, partial [Myxococcota bacterium]